MPISPNQLSQMIEKELNRYMETSALHEKVLKAFNRILQDNGFADSPYLKDYDLTCEYKDGGIEIILNLDDKALSEETRRKMRSETKNKFTKESDVVKSRTDAKNFRFTYMQGPRGKPERIQGSRDARRIFNDGRKFTKDGRKVASDRDNKKEPVTPGQRYVNHEFKATAPRGMDVDNQGKIRLAMQREIRNTKRRVIFPQGETQGIVKMLLDSISEIMEKDFEKMLEQELKGEL